MSFAGAVWTEDAFTGAWKQRTDASGSARQAGDAAIGKLNDVGAAKRSRRFLQAAIPIQVRGVEVHGIFEVPQRGRGIALLQLENPKVVSCRRRLRCW